MFNSFLQEIESELKKGCSEFGHPFKALTLATLDKNQLPQQRIVILRKINSELKLTFFTDLRSKKVKQIKNNEQVSAHFYHMEKKLQLVFRATAQLEQDEESLQNLWQQVRIRNQKDYTTNLAPGSIIQQPDNIEYLNQQNYFGVVHLIPQKIEYLKLNQPQHLRILFKKKESNWNGQFLVP